MTVPIGRSNHAYILAEKHEDFRTLVELCQNPVYGSAAKTEHYIQKYQKDFAFSLYQWLVEKGELSSMECRLVSRIGQANSKHL